jgi:protein arginine N-methyltransferase 1
MIADEARTGAFVRALRQAVTPDSVVVDIGAGTGIFALLACRFGARRVYAIEPDDAIEVARQIAAANGYADRIEFIQNVSTQVTLPERADLIISDLSGVLPWFQQHIPSIADARRRLLVPGGVLIPARDTAWAAVIEAKDLYARRTGGWESNAFGLDMEAARRIVINTWSQGRVTSDNLLTGLERWATLDYATVEDPNVRAHMTWTVTRSGTGHGLAAGFERTVSDGLCMSNAPDTPKASRADAYGTVFFPWSAPRRAGGWRRGERRSGSQADQQRLCLELEDACLGSGTVRGRQGRFHAVHVLWCAAVSGHTAEEGCQLHPDAQRGWPNRSGHSGSDDRGNVIGRDRSTGGDRVLDPLS